MTCETGLLIGGNDSFGIGGIDKAMIRQSFNGNSPYIPGSSLKGKMRHLLEQSLGKIISSDVHSCDPNKGEDPGNCEVCRIFGSGKTENAQGLTRLIVRDAKLIIAQSDAPAHAQSGLKDYVDRVAEFQRQHGSYIEIKTENYIDRKTGAAVAPRRFERVPAGMKFAIDLVYRIFDQQQDGAGGQAENKDLAFFRHVADALDLVRWEYVGASGSRGYGRVNFSDLRLTFTDALSREEKCSADIEAEGLREWSPKDDLANAIKALSASSSSGNPDAAESLPPSESAAEAAPASQGEQSNES
jgi:CRISPR-associated protein Csm3